MALNNNSNSVFQNKQLEKEYEKNIAEIKNLYRKDQIDALEAIRNIVKTIKGKIATWEHESLFRTPVDGKVIFFKIWDINQYVTYGEAVFVILPPTREFKIKAKLPLFKAGKVESGQTAFIKLNEYPFEEFGMVKALVKDVTAVSLDSSYIVELIVEQNFVTTRKRVIKINPEAEGVVDIITDNRSVLQRILDGLFGKLSR
ncbi:MAG: HlyD family efflux transporter periplasmic adaptor subunit [Agriterribacter sp.]